MAYNLLSKQRKTARKAHRCVWCDYPVIVGSQYLREVSTYDGYFQNHAWHEACDGFAQQSCGPEDELELGGNEMRFFALYQLEAPTKGGAA